MIMMHEGAEIYSMSKPVTCPACKRGRIGNIPGWSKASISRRGKPPPEQRGDGILVKCALCGTYWLLTIE